MAQTAADSEANIIFGSVVDDAMGDDVKITVIATGFAQKEAPIRLTQAAQMCAPAAVARSAAASPAAAIEPARRAESRKEQPATVPVRLTAAMAAAAAPPPRPPPMPTRGRERVPEPPAFRPGDEDQYDIPAFLRLRGGQGGVPE
jgi:cell division protein FtsZ